MEDTIKKAHDSIRYGFAIKFLSIIATCALLCSILTSWCFYEIEHCFSAVLTIIPAALLNGYLFLLRNKPKADIILPVIFCVFGFNVFYNFVMDNGNSFIYPAFNNEFNLMFDHGYVLYYVIEDLFRILDLFIFVLPLLILFLTYKKLNVKLTSILTITLYLVYNLLILVNIGVSFRSYLNRHTFLYGFAFPMNLIGITALCVALLLLYLTNDIHAVEIANAKKTSNKSIDPKKALIQLKENFELGVISEEEYNAQRTEIISKL